MGCRHQGFVTPNGGEDRRRPLRPPVRGCGLPHRALCALFSFLLQGLSFFVRPHRVMELAATYGFLMQPAARLSRVLNLAVGAQAAAVRAPPVAVADEGNQAQLLIWRGQPLIQQVTVLLFQVLLAGPLPYLR